VGRLTACLAVTLAAATAGCELRDDDRLVDPAGPEARRAVEVARGVVEGRLVDVRRDVDNGKWEVTLRQGEREYEVELAPGDLALLRIDYD
jgi:hypothetical protein